MIRKIAFTRIPLFWLAFHILLGLVSTVTPVAIIIWFYLVLASSVYALFQSRSGTFFFITSLIVYLSAFELLARMAYSSPYIPYESGKYLFFVLLLLGILKGYHKGTIGWWMLLLLLPGIFVGLASQTTRQGLVFNVIGAANIALAVIYFKNQLIRKSEMIGLLRLLLYPVLSVLSYTIIKTPKYSEIDFNLSSLADTTGGFGSNQVSTAFGLACFIIFLFIMYRWQFSGYRWIDIGLLLTFTFQGLLTFSRGGMLGGALGILFVLLYAKGLGNFATQSLWKRRFLLYGIPIGVLLFLSFRIADNVSGGQLSLRYAGETNGTMSGAKEKNLSTITSNRYDIFMDDLSLYSQNPIWGIGVGQSNLNRKHTKGDQAHVEFSRLLSEHGLFGIIYILLLVKIGIDIFQKKNRSTFGAIFLALFVIALFTTFHAATRTYISPLLIGLSLVFVRNYPDRIFAKP